MRNTALLSEQDAWLALSAAERIYVLKNGKVALQGDRESLLTQAHIKEAYLGLA